MDAVRVATEKAFSTLTNICYLFACFQLTDKRVCEQGSLSNAPIPFDTLTPGLCFVTPYGVVEIVNDDRAIPYYALESSDKLDAVESKKRMKMYNNAVLKRQMRDQKQLSNVAIMSLARRILLRHAYDDYSSRNDKVPAIENCFESVKNVAAFVDAIRHAYHVCRDVPHLASNVPKRKELEDPSAPANSFPDRIVECKLLPDQRPRYIGDFEKDEHNAAHNFRLLDGLANIYTNSNRIFIQRRLLTTPYSLDGERYYCPVCYQCFTSKPGYKYHVDTESCVRKAQIKTQAIQQHLQTIESRALQLVDQHRAIVMKPCDGVIAMQDTCDQQSQYLNANRNNLTQGKEIAQQTTDIGNADAANSMHPDSVLAQLESELYRALGKTIGPIYPEVWRALGYRKALPKAKKQVKRHEY